MNPLDYLKITNKDPGDSVVIIESCRDFNPVMSNVAVYYDKDDSVNIANAILEPKTITSRHCCDLFKKKPISALRVVLKQHGKKSFTEYFIEKYGSVEAIFEYLNKKEIDRQSAYQNRNYGESFINNDASSKKESVSVEEGDVEKVIFTKVEMEEQSTEMMRNLPEENITEEDNKTEIKEDNKTVVKESLKDFNKMKNEESSVKLPIINEESDLEDELSKNIDFIINGISENVCNVFSSLIQDNYRQFDEYLDSMKSSMKQDLNNILRDNVETFDDHLSEIKKDVNEGKDKTFDIYLLLKNDEHIREVISEELTSVLAEQLDSLKDTAIEIKQLSLDIKDSIKSLKDLMEDYMETRLKQNTALENIFGLAKENSENLNSLLDQFKETFSDDSDF